jgi:hypothetical protein
MAFSSSFSPYPTQTSPQRRAHPSNTPSNLSAHPPKVFPISVRNIAANTHGGQNDPSQCSSSNGRMFGCEFEVSNGEKRGINPDSFGGG